MEKITFLSLVISLIIGSCAKQESKFPQGAWKNVLSQMIKTDSSGKVTSVDYPVVFTKMWSEKNFSFIGQYKQDTIMRDFYGGGTYELKGNRYDEFEIYHFSKPGSVLNIHNKMLLELRNDTLIQSYPVDDNGQGIKKNYYVEKYIRLK